jgi:hypothetical protein
MLCFGLGALGAHLEGFGSLWTIYLRMLGWADTALQSLAWSMSITKIRM